MTENFYRDIAALQDRERGPEMATSSQATDLYTWVMDYLEPRTGDSIMDIGSGSGKRALSLARIVGETGHILAIDRSYKTLSMLAQKSQEIGLERRIRLLQINLDELDGHLRSGDFDRALSSNALYQIRQPRAVFKAIYLALKPGGVFFFYGPSRKDNAEFKRFYAVLLDQTSLAENHEDVFLEEVGLPHIEDFFSQVTVVKFEKFLRFASPEALYTYWSEGKFYDELVDRDFRRAAVRYFQSHTVFETAQRIAGIRATR
jgi:ubiquinone/menaquinone biosynthesis C-methylase UbiE